MSTAYASGLTPSAIALLLRIYSVPDAMDMAARADPGGTANAARELRDEGLVEDELGQILRASERGVAFAKHIMNTPLPVQSWHVHRYPETSS